MFRLAISGSWLSGLGGTFYVLYTIHIWMVNMRIVLSYIWLFNEYDYYHYLRTSYIYDAYSHTWNSISHLSSGLPSECFCLSSASSFSWISILSELFHIYHFHTSCARSFVLWQIIYNNIFLRWKIHFILDTLHPGCFLSFHFNI